MPTIFSHAIFASAIGAAVETRRVPLRFWVLTSACAMLPDADVIGFIFRVQYGSMLAHRGITHSIGFAVVVGILAATFFDGRPRIPELKRTLYFAAVTFTHPLLDMLTDGGSGAALFAPFSGERYFFPWRPVEVSPLGTRFFGERGVAVILSEIVWIWLPSLLIVARSRLRPQRSNLNSP